MGEKQLDSGGEPLDDKMAMIAFTHGHQRRRAYETSGNPAVLREAISLLRTASATGGRIPDLRPLALGDLGLALRAWVHLAEDAALLAEAIAAHEEAYATISADSPHKAGMAGNLAGTLRMQLERQGIPALGDLDRVLSLYQEAADGAAPAYRPTALANLANGYRTRFDVSSDRTDLDRAVHAALAALAEGVDDAPLPLSTAAKLLARRGRLDGSRDDAARALELAEASLAAAPVGSPHHAAICAGLAGVLMDWYVVTGELGALDRALEVCRRGFAVAGERDRAYLWLNLSAAHRFRYDVYQRRDDLTRAVEAMQHVFDGPLELMPHPIGCLRTAAALHTLVAAEFRQPRYFASATALLNEARRRLPPEHVVQSAVIAQLGSVAYQRWELEGDLDMLRESVRLQEQAWDSLVEFVDTPNRQRTRYMLACAVSSLGAATGDPVRLAQAAQHFAELAEFGIPGLDTDLAISAADARGKHATRAGEHTVAAEAFGHAWALVRARFAQEVTCRHREGALRASQGVAGRAAVALACVGQAEAAAVAAETGQAVMASEAAQREQLSLDRVAAVDEQLASRLGDAARRLREAERTDRSDSVDDTDAALAMLTRARRDFDQVLADVQAIDGLQDVLAPPTQADLKAAAQDGPLVYLIAEAYTGLALVVQHNGTVTPVPLPDFTVRDLAPKAVELAKLRPGQLGAAERFQAVLDWLGETAVQPWLNLVPAKPDDPPLRLVPVGVLARLPLHAATVRIGTADPGPLAHQRALALVPNARAATAARRRAEVLDGEQLLIVSDPRPSTAAPLPAARAEAERIADAYQDATVLVGEQATREQVLAHLPAAGLVHLACHAFAHPRQPRESAVLLAHDERLSVRDMAATNLAARLVLLSACETAVVGLTLPNEAIGLATAVLGAGAAGVIASQWQVPDIAAAVLMTRLHGHLRNGATPPVALARAQGELRQLTNTELATQWPELVTEPPALSGPARRFWSRGRPFDDPRCWAAFIYIGA
ncbi:CHAT domain-containing protein [Streptomyces sp. AHU1]|uniref:CHAT domain-containing protein n=1 Tax=Streptomyces sp. AHU1 TaxID=3377215 RepID=UPI003877A3AD